MNGQERVIIENPGPRIGNGEFPVKRVVNDLVIARADIFCDGHDVLSATLHYKRKEDAQWETLSMEHEVNDRWSATFQVSQPGIYQISFSAWVDHFKSWHHDTLKKIEAGVEYQSDLLSGAAIIKQTMESYPTMPEEEKRSMETFAKGLSQKQKEPSRRIEPLLDGSLYDLLVRYPIRDHEVRYPGELEILVEREKASFSSWYEVFPRSLGPDAQTHGTFKDCIKFLSYVEELGFDVLYLPPIHPIGETNRKGRNNSITSEPGDPGSPWAIGNSDGGHKAIHRELGTLADFRQLVKKGAEKGIDIAMDIAFQCSADHPWLKEHPRWFKQRPDGTLQYAENPPKKYEDIYPLNFETEDWENLWEELKGVFEYWIGQGIRIFRVDNPHTKSFRFWGWVIGEIRRSHPDVILLAEAFTRPKLMYQLAKLGFTQSYTYFTWRHTKYDLTTYMEELLEGETGEFFRPNFWPNTPDILPEFLQMTNRSGYIQRLILAATLSSNYGIYGPAFELMESTPAHPGTEEYLNSEKYELKQWNTSSTGSMQKIIKRVNKLRKENRALQNTRTLLFHPIDNEALLCYSKRSADLENIILVVVNLDPNHTQAGWVHLPLEKFGLDPHEPFQVYDLLSGAFFLWSGERNFVEIDPGVMPAHIFRVRRKVRSERDFDYFI
jgi:starch synthase (maltosyl-transferring)